MDKQEVYKIAVNTRQTEIQLFWQRSNYFMVLNIAIAVGFFALKNESYDPVLAGLGAPILAALGAAVSVLWFLINLGGKFWQVFWEEAAARLERECCPEARLFAASTEFIRQEVENGLNNSDGRFREWLDTLILKKTFCDLSNDISFFHIRAVLGGRVHAIHSYQVAHSSQTQTRRCT